MRTQDRLFRFTAVVTASSLMLAPMMLQPVLAQPAPPGGTLTQQTRGDPPDRVGRLARIIGTVSFHAADDTQWSQATLNYPVTSGNAFWAGPNAEADIDISASRIVLASATEFDINTLDTAILQATQPQGEIYVHIRALAPNEIYMVQTPRGQITIAVPGRYEIIAGDTSNPTEVTVLEGAAQVSGPNLSLDIAANQTATITGTDSFVGSIQPAQHDVFLTAMLSREQAAPAQAVAPPPVVAQMTGADDLYNYGTWSQVPEYGQVWYPQVAAGWVPYREGHWAYVAPWGWTWIDNAPWGFAPFHYGRWVDIGGRWGWTPGMAVGIYTPVYAPALVTFFGVGAGIGVGAAITAGSVGWCPLGWREPYRPWYHTSPSYVRDLNPHVTNITTINQNITINNFANRSAATIAPASAVAASQPIQRFGQRATLQQLAQARPVIGQEPLRPTLATAGVTPAVAQQLHLPPVRVGTAASARVAAPGPAIREQPTAVNSGAKPVPPPLQKPEVVTQEPATVPSGPAARGAIGKPGGAPGAAITPRGPGVPAVTAPVTGAPGTGASTRPLSAPGTRPGPALPGQAPAPPITPHSGTAVTGSPGTPSIAAPVTGAPAAGIATPQLAAPGAMPREAPHVAGPPQQMQAAPPAQVQVAPAPAIHTAPPAPVVAAPSPPTTPHTAPPAQVHVAPPPPCMPYRLHPS